MIVDMKYRGPGSKLTEMEKVKRARKIKLAQKDVELKRKLSQPAPRPRGRAAPNAPRVTKTTKPSLGQGRSAKRK